ncbi:MAG: biopolymer transporter ExbD [Pirellulales bacterium]
MDTRFGLGSTGFDELVLRQPHREPPEFDMTAMVDLVFMMNIYFLVTFVTVALSGVDLPSASHVAPLDADSSVVITVEGGDGKPVVVFLGDREKGEAIRDAEQQEERIRAAVEQGVAEGKTDVLLKAEKKLRLGDLFRISSAAFSVEGLKLNVAVMEKDKP